MPLKVSPVRVKRTYYLLIPQDIAKMHDIQSSDEFTMTVEKEKDDLVLEYKKKSRDGQ